LLGNGERSGNVDIVTLAMNLYSHGIDPGLRFEDMKEVVRIVESSTLLPVHPRHPYAGDLVFAAFSGSHQDAIHKGYKHMVGSKSAIWEVPYLPIDPADIGRQYEPVIRINSQSGKSGLLHVLERDFGYRVPRDLAIEFSRAVQAVADSRGEELSSAAVHELFEATYLRATGEITLDSVGVERRANGRECAVSARLFVAGSVRNVQGMGNGPIEAFSHAVALVCPRPFEIVDYSEHARGSGADADAVAYVAVRVNDAVHYGVARDSDVVVASLRALLAGLNRATHVAAAFADSASSGA
jgi:2-isopropylmalate synthase